MSNFRIRPITVLLFLVGVLFIVGGIVYFTETAHDLPAFFPGHDVHSTTHHTKHGLTFIILAILALVAAWFTTAPDRPDKHEPPNPRSKASQ
jgi:H+/Cl- antiporter ClcA